ncbi:MAG TPA: tetratricopeptide repeat protein [Opitutaceae bacterium]|nr:tetratricopeptide repeat protein [Opitutaceae bacterium]
MPTSGDPPAPAWSDRAGWLAGTVIVLAVFAAYSNSLRAPFVFDDEWAVTRNATIRDLRQIGTVLAANTGNGSGVRGRPLVNLSLAVNHALGGVNVWGYHAFNLAVHALCALLLFALLRRVVVGSVEAQACPSTSSGPRAEPRGCAQIQGRDKIAPLRGDALAFAVALLWAVHPLQSETVICPIQRTESLMALFYLLTLYLVVRSAESSRAGWWQAGAAAACLAGMACKEVMVTAPLVVLLVDRTFLAGSFAEAWRRRRGMYAALAGTWLLLGLLVATSGGRGGTVGFGLGVSPWDYALTQCRALVMYLQLAFWPHPLVVDYGMGLETSLAAVWPQALLVVALLAATAWALVQRPVLGFAGAWFFVILAPSSSVLPLASQTVAEHRMYLPVAAVLTALVLGLHSLIRRRAVVLTFALTLAAAFAALTVRRTADYRSEPGLWRDTVAKVPASARAHYNLGVLLDRAGQTAEALAQFETALRLKPDYAPAFNNRGDVRFRQGELDAAAADFAAAVRSDPNLAEARYNLGRVRFQQDRVPEAIADYEAALRLDPDYPDALVNLGIALARADRPAEALEHLRAAVRREPADADAQYNLGRVLDQEGKLDEAVAAYQAAVRLQPGLVAAHNNLAYVLVRLGRPGEALAESEQAVRLAPADVDARVNLGNLLLGLDRGAEAIADYEAALRLAPADPEIHYALAVALAQAGRPAEARRHLAEALRLRPGFAPARELLQRLPTPGGAGEP